jgi:predicted alpha/beta superfamily hydrolase
MQVEGVTVECDLPSQRLLNSYPSDQFHRYLSIVPSVVWDKSEGLRGMTSQKVLELDLQQGYSSGQHERED